MFGPIENLIFDFDGTLIDSMTSVVEGMGYAIEKITGKAPPPYEELLESFGPAPQTVLEFWVGKEKVEEAGRHWLEFNDKLGMNAFRPFEGIEDMLQVLKKDKYSLMIFTGRDRESTLKIMKHHSWLPEIFKDESYLICGDDGMKPKPSGEGIERLVKKFNLDRSKTLMVGDHPHDLTAGREAGVKTAAVVWDLSSVPGVTERSRFKKQWSKWPEDLCDLRLSHPTSLISWLAKT